MYIFPEKLKSESLIIPPASGKAGPRVLVVDDSQLMRAVIRNALEECGFDIMEAEDGVQGLEMARQSRPDLVLLDICMPKLDGFATCNRLRKEFSNNELPVVMLTGQNDADSIKEAYRSGATDFISKSPDVAGLVQRVCQILRRQMPYFQLHRSQGVNHQKLSLAVEASPAIVMITDTSGGIEYVNPAFTAVTGYFPEEILGKNASVLGSQSPMEQEKMYVSLAGGGEWHGELLYRKKSGVLYWERAAISSIKDAQGRITQFIKVAEDITEKKRTEEALKNTHRALKTVLRCNEALALAKEEQELLDETCRILVNVGNYRFAWIGFAQENEEKTVRPVASAGVEGKYLKNLKISWAANEYDMEPTGRAIRSGAPAVASDIATGFGCGVLRDSATPEGYASSIALPLLHDGKAFGALNIYADQPYAFAEEEKKLLSELTRHLAYGLQSLREQKKRREVETTISFLTNFDVLTQLPNRVFFLDRLHQALIRNRRSGELLAVMSLDLDHFRQVNSSLGNASGDRVLEQVAERLSNALRASDTVARHGGDSFKILLPKITREDDAAQVAQTLLASLRRPFFIAGQALYLSASLGIALFPVDGEDCAILVDNSEAALHRAKEEGGIGYQFFVPEFKSRAVERMALAGGLHKALEKKEFLLHYQPQLNGKSGALAGAEALVRWQHPERGLIPPGDFVPLAEKTDLIIQIGDWVLHEACRQNRIWQKAARGPVKIAVNLSAKQFQQMDFPERVGRILKDTRLPPNLLEMEITESAIMQDVDKTVDIMKNLKAMGVSLSVDDFGTGYSSFSYLKRFPIDILKIDRSFIVDVIKDSDNDSIVHALISLAHSLRLKAVAEGVETDVQRRFLREADCDFLQGNLLGYPISAEEFTRRMGADHLFFQ